MTITRRALVTSGTALAAAGALTGPALLEWAKAWAQTAPWKPESGAQLSMLRWKYFVQSEDDAFVALIDAFTKATGVKVNISRESYEDVQPKASVAANTGAGPDLFWGLYSLPHLFPQKCVDVSDVADYLGKKYGGWVPSAVTYGKSGNKWIAIPICYSGNMHELPDLVAEESGVLQVSRRRRTSSSNSPRRRSATARPAAWRSATPPATATAGCIGACGRTAAIWSTRTTR